MYRQSDKNLLNGNMSSICPHDILNFGPLTAEFLWRVWGTPANFNGFRVLASLLYRRRSTDVSQTLHDVWPYSYAGIQYIHFRRLLPGALKLQEWTMQEWTMTKFCQLQNSLCVQVFRSPILAALLHGTRAVGVSQPLQRGTRNVNYGTDIMRTGLRT